MSSSFQVHSRHSIGAAQWNAFVEETPEAWLWHRYELQEALLTWPGRDDCGFCISSSQGEWLALLPLQTVTRRIGPMSIKLLDSLGGWTVKPTMGERTRRQLLSFLEKTLNAAAKSQNAVDVRLSLPAMAPAWRGELCPRVNPLLEIGCCNTLTQTWVVDLRTGKEALWRGLEGRARTAVRKAEKSGVTVRLAGRPGDLDEYYRLHCKTYLRTGMQPHAKAYFEAIWRDFLPAGLACCWFAEHDGEVVAAETFAVFKGAALYWTGAASDKGLRLEANSLLQWTAMQWMMDNGLEWYETGEGFPGNRTGKKKGLNDFKKSFGGKLYPYYKGTLPQRGILPALYRGLREFSVL